MSGSCELQWTWAAASSGRDPTAQATEAIATSITLASAYSSTARSRREAVTSLFCWNPLCSFRCTRVLLARVSRVSSLGLRATTLTRNKLIF